MAFQKFINNYFIKCRYTFSNMFLTRKYIIYNYVVNKLIEQLRSKIVAIFLFRLLTAILHQQ
jgi:hypothetical protein